MPGSRIVAGDVHPDCPGHKRQFSIRQLFEPVWRDDEQSQIGNGGDGYCIRSWVKFPALRLLTAYIP
jgi:hypothetical protein